MIRISASLPLSDFPLEVELALEGRCVALLGPSGAGKTSLLELIAGLRKPSRAHLEVDGQVLQDERTVVPPERRRIGYVPQDALLFPHLTARENVFFGAKALEQRRLAELWIERLELIDLRSRRPAQLSGGEKQRVALARALATDPRLLLLDEPLAALDSELRQRVLPRLLRVRHEAAVPILYVTHHVSEARALADEFVWLERGRVVEHGPSTSLDRRAMDAAENVLIGTLQERDGSWRLELAEGPWLAVVADETFRATERAAFAVSADDLILSVAAPSGLSTRNVLEARVIALQPRVADVRVRLSAAGREWIAAITHAAQVELQLRVEQTVWLAMKAHSLRRL